MRLSKRKIRKAENIIRKANLQKEKKEAARKAEIEKRQEEYRKELAIRQRLRDAAAKKIVARFELDNEPRFKEGEKVRINRYGVGNSWEGSLSSYLRQTNNDIGPAIVTITKRYIDKSYLYEILEKMEDKQYEMLKDIKANDFSAYMGAWKKYIRDLGTSHFPLVGYSYIVEYKGKNLTEKYGSGFRENNFVRLNSDHEKWVLEAWALEKEEKVLSKKRIEIRKKRFKIETRRNQMAKENPSLGLSYITNLPKTEEEYLEKGWG